MSARYSTTTNHPQRRLVRSGSDGARGEWIELTVERSAVKSKRNGDKAEDILGGLIAAFGGGGVAALILGGLGGRVVAGEEWGGGGGEGEGKKGHD